MLIRVMRGSEVVFYKRRQAVKEKLSTGYECFECRQFFSRARQLHKHQGVFWPFCKASNPLPLVYKQGTDIKKDL